MINHIIALILGVSEKTENLSLWGFYQPTKKK